MSSRGWLFADPIGIKGLLLAAALAASAPTSAVAAGAPIPVLPVDIAGPSQVVNLQKVFSLVGGIGTTVLYTVPVGKRLIIETVAATTETFTDTPNPLTVLVVVNGFGAFIAFPAVPSGSLSSGTANVRLYAEGGTQVLGRVFGKSTANDSVGVNISGHLVDATGTTATTSGAAATASMPSYSGNATMP